MQLTKSRDCQVGTYSCAQLSKRRGILIASRVLKTELKSLNLTFLYIR